MRLVREIDLTLVVRFSIRIQAVILSLKLFGVLPVPLWAVLLPTIVGTLYVVGAVIYMFAIALMEMIGEGSE